MNTAGAASHHQNPPGGARPTLGREYTLVLAAALVFYVICAAPGVLWQDSGLAQVRVLEHDLIGTLGLALSHALYYLLAIAFQSLPLSESAFKTNLVSAVFGAVTVANIYLFLRLVTGRRRGAVVGMLSLAVAHTFWQHCALAEVYTVTTALLGAELLCLYQYHATRRPRWIVLLMLANGLGISNHMIASLSLACYGIWLLALLARRKVRLPVAAAAAGAWVAGAALYLGLIAWRIHAGAGVGPTIHSALFGTGFAHNVLNVVPGPRQLLNSILYLGLSFPTPAALLALPGLAALWRTRYPTLRNVLLGLLAIHLLWAIRYDVPDQYTFFIPALVLIAVLIGLGADRFLASRASRWLAVVVVAAILPAGVYAVLPGLARRAGLRLGVTRAVPYRDAYTYFLRPWKTGYHGADRFACEAAKLLTPGTVLVADGTTVRPIHYYRITRGWFDGVRIYPPIRKPGQPKVHPTPAALADALARRAVFVVTPQRGYCPQWLLDGYRFERVGVLYRVVGPREHRTHAPAGDGGGKRR